MTDYRSSRKSVDVRADKLPKEYQSKAHNLDKAYNGVSDDQVGPVEQKLNSFGNLLCLVVGQFGDCSQDLQNLLKTFAESRVLKVCRSGGYLAEESKLSLVHQQYIRRLSVCAI